jgi:glycosyltransferase involved in cell wall biosynthesis
MKVIVNIISSLKRGGRERQLSIIAKHSTRYQNIIIYYNEAQVNYIDEYQLSNIAIHVKEKGFIARVTKTVKICKSYDAKAVISWGTLETVVGMMVSILVRIPLINFSIRHGIRKKQLSHFFRSFLLHLSKYVVANSKAGLQANNLSKGIIIYNGVENIPEVFTKELNKNDSINNQNHNNKMVFISVANLVPYKDYYTVLKAFKGLKEISSEFLYIIIGEGPNRARIEEIIDEYDLKENVLLTGSVQNVDDYLKMSDVMIHSSLGEGCSNAILEGMKSGLPIIASNVGGIPEIIDAENAMLFEYSDSKGLLNYMNKFIEDPLLSARLGQLSLNHVRDCFSVNKMIAQFEKVVQAILVKDTTEISRLQTKVRQ